MQLHTKIVIGLIAGVVVGFVANVLDLVWLQNFLGQFEAIGTAWIRLITMIVVPLVVASLVVGTASLGDITKLGRIGGKTLAYYMTTTAIAVTIGLLFANLIKPGSGVDQATTDQLAAQFSGQAEVSMMLADQQRTSICSRSSSSP